MGKPWAKYEQNYINHPKFLALTANAICLWLEGKNYCDLHLTDGMIPREALKMFRFTDRRSVLLLTTIVAGYAAPLWETHAIGFKMHDYLDHNDCREVVLARIEAAEDSKEIRKAANRERQRKFREEQKRKANALRNGDITRTSQGPTETATETARKIRLASS